METEVPAKRLCVPHKHRTNRAPREYAPWPRADHGRSGRRCAPEGQRGAQGKDKNGKPVMESKYALHAFRHFIASWCINPKERGGRELPAKVVQHLLGHSSIVMTLDVYGHLFPRGDDRAELARASQALLA